MVPGDTLMEAIVLMNPPARVFSDPSEAINERTEELGASAC